MNVDDDKDNIVDGDGDDAGRLKRDRDKSDNTLSDDGFDESSSEDEANDGLEEDGDEITAEEDEEGDESPDEDDEEDEEEREEDKEKEDKSKDVLNIGSPESSNSSEGNQCPICLNGLNLGQDIGAPITCVNTHLFCFDCLEEWSKNVNTCPVDRKEFNVIIVTKGLNGPIIDKIEITNRTFTLDEQLADSNLEDVTYCEICGRCDREDRLLLCDNCDFGYHCECLDPPLEVIPIEEWYCPDCHRSLFGSDSDEQGPNYLQEINRYNRRRGRRVIARTRASELVRNRIEMRRVAYNSDPEFEPIRVTSSSTAPRRRTIRRRRRCRKRSRKIKTKRSSGTKRTSTAKSRCKTKTTKRRKTRKTKSTKCRSKRSRAASRPLAAPTPRSRISNKLGLERNTKLGVYSLPTRKKLPETNLCNRRAAAGIGQLSIFGSELNFHGSVPLREDFVDYPTMHRGGESSSDVLCRVRRPLTSLPNMRNRTKQILLDQPAISQITSCDLLGDILEHQKVLLTSAKDVIINRDGTLRLKDSPVDKTSGRNCAGGSNGDGSPSRSENGSTNCPNHGSTSSPQTDPQGSSSSFRAITTNPNSRNNSSPIISRDVNDDHDFVISKPVPLFTRSPVRNEEDSKKNDNLDNAFLTENEKVTSVENVDETGGDVDIYSDIESIGESENNINSNGPSYLGLGISRVKPSGRSPSQTSDNSDDNNLVIDDHHEPAQEEKDNKTPDKIEDDKHNLSDSSNLKDTDISDKSKKADVKEEDNIKNEQVFKTKETKMREENDNEQQEKPTLKLEQNHVSSFNSHIQRMTENSADNKPDDRVSQEKNKLPTTIIEIVDTSPLPNGHINKELLEKEDEKLSSQGNQVSNEEDAYGPLLPPESIKPTTTEHKQNKGKFSNSEELTKKKSNHDKERKQSEIEEGEIAETDSKSGVPKIRRCKHGKLIHSHKKHKENKDSKESKESKECKESKEAKEVKEVKEAKEVKEVKEVKEMKEMKEMKEVKEVEEIKESKPRSTSRDKKVKEVSKPTLIQEPLVKQEETKPKADKSHSLEKNYHLSNVSEKRVSKENEDVWKKVSTSSKMRSYRDGKPKDPQILFRERQLAKKAARGKDEERNKPDEERENKDRGKHSSSRLHESDYRRRSRSPEERVSRHREDEKNHLRDDRFSETKKRIRDSPTRERISPVSKGSDKLSKHKSSRKNDTKAPVSPIRRESRKISPRQETHENKMNDSKRKQPNPDSEEEEEERSRTKKKKRKHKHGKSKYDTDVSPEVKNYDLVENSKKLPVNSSEKRSASANRHHKHHKKSKHRHHSRDDQSPSLHKPATPLEEDKDVKSSIKPKSKKSRRLSSDREHLINRDGKEIRTKGGKILSNISFSEGGDVKEFKEDAGNNKMPRSPPELKSTHSKPGSPPKKDVRLVSKSRTEFDIFWVENSQNKKLNSAHSEEPPSDKNGNNDKEETGLRFLPRTLLSDPSSPNVCLPPTAGPKTPPDDERLEKNTPMSSPDQTMPTPTQDESLEGDYSNESPNMQRSSIKSLNSPSVDPMPDIYDPEAPLESPEDDQLLKSEIARSQSKLNEMEKQSPALEKQISPSKNVPRPETPELPSLRSPHSKQHKFKSPNSFKSPNILPKTSVPGTTRTPSKPTLAESSMPPAPGSLLAQIQQTLNLQNKSHTSYSESQKQSQSNQSLVNSSSHSSSIHGKSNLPLNSIGSIGNNFSSGTGLPVNNDAQSRGSMAPSNPCNVLSPSLQTLLQSLIKAAEQQQSKTKSSKSSSLNLNNVFKKPAPVLTKEPSPSCKKPPSSSSTSSLSSKSRSGTHLHHHSIKTTVVDKNGPKKVPLMTQGNTTGPTPTPGMKLSDVAVLDDVPSSAVELQVKEKYLKKLNRQERVIEEVKMVLKPFYQRKEVTKDEYKEIMRKAVPKICHSKSGEINPQKVRLLVEGYVQRFKHARKKNKVAKGK